MFADLKVKGEQAFRRKEYFTAIRHYTDVRLSSHFETVERLFAFLLEFMVIESLIVYREFCSCIID